MKIENLAIENFRGIALASLQSLGGMVIIAGQNGSGKSCIFDAIRLLKSAYGGYQANEWQQWMGEFQINLASRSVDFAAMFNDPKRELRITCDFRFAETERQYMQRHGEELLRETIWRTILPEAYSWGGLRMAMFASQFREREPEVAERARAQYPRLMAELAAPSVRAAVFIPPGQTPQIDESLVLSVAFSTFRPTDIGVIDYHGAQRHYGREQVQGINLNLDANEQQRSQSTLYNYAAKYANVKGEMAASFVRELLAEAAGVPRPNQLTLSNTLQDLFATFFPDKRFLGPQATPSGLLRFPVVTQGGNEHDLDELSAGEKEILYGYLRIRNSAPRFSVILLDEPELHLNPRLIRGLPQFYRRHLGEALGNQLWLVTHSDALLREVVGRETYNVFHMLPCGTVPTGQSQSKPLAATADLELALVDLVGDLAAYRPGGKVVIFEGGGDTDFDKRVALTLFPALQEHANLISGSNKIRVRALHETLEAAAAKGQLPFKFFSITDRDSASAGHTTPVNQFSWDVYHIENYFLAPPFIRRVLESLNLGTSLGDDEIWDQLRACAHDAIPQLIRHELGEATNQALVSAINTRTDPKSGEIADLLHAAVIGSLERLNQLHLTSLSKTTLEDREAVLRSKHTESLADGSWVLKCRGRDVLRRFAGKHAAGVPYEIFRNLVLWQMKDDGYQPDGMKRVVEAVLAA